MDDDSNKNGSVDQNKTRTYLALGITGISIFGLLVLSAIIILASNDKTIERSQLIFNSVLPLFGTWVGTVMAYFFSKENFESASRSVERLTRQLTSQEKILTSTPVTDVMVPRSQMMVAVDPTNTKLLETLKLLEGRGYRYLPVLNSDDSLLALLHTVGVIEYLYRIKEGIPAEEREALTIQNILDEHPEFKKPYSVVKEGGTLADAQDAMNKIAESRVVFVTAGGTDREPVRGMLTSIDIAKRVQV